MNEELSKKLTAEFSPDVIKTRAGRNRTLSHAPTYVYVQRLIDTRPLGYSTEIVSHEAFNGEAIIKMKFTLHGDQEISVEAIGGCKLPGEDGRGLGVADAFKGACSDALKKCLSLLGVGLHLYDNDPARGAAEDDHKPASRKKAASAGREKATKKAADKPATPPTAEDHRTEELLDEL